MNEYEQRLKNIGIKLKQCYIGAKQHHNMQCMNCNHTWIATPLSKLQSNRKRGGNGCPNCNENKKQIKYKEKQLQFIAKIQNRGFEILTPHFNGIQNHGGKIKVKNTKCGHIFDTGVRNVISRNVICPICNIQLKIDRCANNAANIHNKWSETATEWKLYKSATNTVTRKSYRNHKTIINPFNLSFGLAGVSGAHHLDHIVPIRYCFEHNIPAEICGDYTNLQVISWETNITSRDKLKPNTSVPIIFEQYISTANYVALV